MSSVGLRSRYSEIRRLSQLTAVPFVLLLFPVCIDIIGGGSGILATGFGFANPNSSGPFQGQARRQSQLQVEQRQVQRVSFMGKMERVADSEKRRKVVQLRSMESDATGSTVASTATSSSTDGEELEIVKVTKEMNRLAKEGLPFTESELDDIVASFRNICPPSANDDDDDDEKFFGEVRALMKDVGHLPHKKWEQTGRSALLLQNLLFPPQNDNDNDNNNENDEQTQRFEAMFDRVIKEGNWKAALEHASSADESDKPWAILVTGVNGIRKTTSVYQPWFQNLLSEALLAPPLSNNNDTHKLQLPTGDNSFFRQLDHMIATLANTHFRKLYALTSQSHSFSDSAQPPKHVIDQYSNLKAAIFARYRTPSEILGVLLLRRASSRRMNVMIETSGRDMAMFHYVDAFFSSQTYRKLVLHFTVDDLHCAEQSVDARMVSEMQVGIQALDQWDAASDADTFEAVRKMIRANQGGPYGSDVLRGVRDDSDRVWEQISKNRGDKEYSGVGTDWYQASIRIRASTTQDWTACAVKQDGSDGTIHTFVPPRSL